MTVGVKQKQAFTLVELLILIAIIGVLGLIVLSAIAGADAKARRITCFDNLKQLGVSFSSFAHNHEGRLPLALSVNEGGSRDWTHLENYPKHFQVLPDLPSSQVLSCPSDSRKSVNQWAKLQTLNMSYFLNLAAMDLQKDEVLVGDRNLLKERLPLGAGAHRIQEVSSLQWSKDLHGSRGHILKTDSSVQLLSTRTLQEAFKESKTTSLNLMVP